MKFKKSLIIAFMLAFTSTSFAQNISGVITDAETGEPLIGVILRNTSSNTGASTSFDGSYTIEANQGDIINISYIGYKEQNLTVGQDNFNAISLLLDNDALEEVVVIGYGQQLKSEVTGSVSVVDAEVIEDIQPVQVAEALQGTTAGVNVTQTSGAPGAGLNIRIRGVGTNGVAGPSVIIDGYLGNMSLLNPDDIESITVLKDAQAAIYGTLGANGIILVTTKSGERNQKPKVSLNTYFGTQNTTRTLPTLNSTEYAILVNESYANAGEPLPYPDLSQIGATTDWQDLLFQSNVPIQSNNLSISGGAENIDYIVSGSLLTQDGIIGEDKTGFLRGTGRAGVNVDISEKLKLNTNVIYTGLTRNSVNESGLGSVLFNALNAPPTLNAYNANGDFSLVPSTTGLGIEIINPLAQVANTYNDFALRKVNGNVGLQYEVIEGLELNGRFGFNTQTQEGKSFAKELDYGGKVFDVTRSSVSQNSQTFNNYSVDVFGNYNREFNDRHDVTFTLGSTLFKATGKGLFATGYDVPNNAWEFADIALALGTSDARDVGSYASDERRGSYFGRIQYDLDDKYLMSVMIREDYSTKFGPNNRSANFPSFTAGWITSKENFWNQQSPITFLKVRGSYGALGNDQIGDLGYVGSLDGEATYVFNNQLTNGVAPGQLPNPDLRWEESQKLDLGFDMELLDNKINLVFDYYNNKRKDLLIPNIPVSGIFGTNAPGASSPAINAGTVQNTGFEFAVGYKGEIKSEFEYALNFNISKINNEVLEVNSATGFLEGGVFGVGQPLAPTRMETGFPIGYFLGYQTDGIFQNQAEVNDHADQTSLGAATSPGDLRYVDVNGDGVLNTEDRVNLGDAIPDYTLGFNFQTSFKNFDFNVYTYGQIGNDLIRNYERVLSDVNQLNYRLDRWTGEGTSNTVPRVTNGATSNNVFSDYFVEDASFMRIQTAQLGYTFDNLGIGKTGTQNAKLYLKGNNLLTMTEYRGFDPGANSGDPIGGGIDYGSYPLARTLILGANLNF